ncbi:hypothetical protein EDE15_2495 [Edaphobacter aggregans]|uniref:TonB-like protein n=1 Tax=Edaphobacter aggregans TaxID=570835 RepID=A0A3R9QA77_9BACT|nr:hypothetical protein [Edaphobacter aggregans]RSL16968.1 hypothetical protein EDE15_2495 [Edaphobacter aggregans]
MHKFWFRSLAAAAFLCSIVSWAQMPGLPQVQGERVDADAALTRALKASSLTYEGKPFHAVMEIGAAGSEYSGRLEVWWADQSKYRMVLTSPKFNQQKVVNGDKVFEKNDGDYYPRWLENFVSAVLDPVPMAKNFRTQGPQVSENCLKHEDRPAGITDELTFEVVCLKSTEPVLDYVLTFYDFMEFKDVKEFESKKIARTYETRVLDFKPVVGRLATLEGLTDLPDAMLMISDATPFEQRTSTAFVSTLKEESLVEKAPEIKWPSVREGKTEGYMIVYARTDRTGQVRETAKHNSDNPGLESFGMEQALNYKFKPLVVDGVPVQMEMPLVLHFKTRLSDPIPELDDATTRKLITGCSLPHEVKDPASAGQNIVITFQVQDDGGLMTLGSSDRKISVMSLFQQFRGCHFAQYKQNGKPTAYHAT